MIERLCKSCGNSFHQYNTMQTICPKCAYNKYAKPQKPIKRYGKKAKAWNKERESWVETNPPDEYGYWVCYLQIADLCPKRIDIDQLTIDHVTPRSRHTATELKPCCIYCNGLKGSRTLEAIQADNNIGSV